MQSKKPRVLSHFVLSPKTEVSLVFAYSEIVELKSVVAKVKWFPEDPNTASPLSLSWSDSLDSHFMYLPRATRPGLKDGPTFILDGPGTLEISYFSWPSRKSITDARISGTYVRTKSSLRGQFFSGLQRIFEVSVTP